MKKEKIDNSRVYNTINDIRKHPRKYINILRDYESYVNEKTKIMSMPNKPKKQLIHGKDSFEKAVQFLESISDNTTPSLRINFALAVLANDILDKKGNDPTLKKGNYKKLNRISFNDEWLNYTDNLDDILIMNLLVCDSETNFREIIFDKELNEVGISAHLSDDKMKAYFEILIGRNFVQNTKVNGMITSSSSNFMTNEEYMKNIISAVEKEIDDKIQKSDIYTNKNYKEMVEEKNIIVNDRNDLVTIIKFYTFKYENDTENEISISKTIKC